MPIDGNIIERFSKASFKSTARLLEGKFTSHVTIESVIDYSDQDRSAAYKRTKNSGPKLNS